MLVDVLRWIASGTGIIAAIIVSLNAGARWTGIGFIIFTFSSVLWITASILGDRDPLMIQNIVLFAINLFGIYRYLWRPRRKAG